MRRPYPPKVVLPVPLSASGDLSEFVEKCIADGVELVCVVGPTADQVEDEIDELLVGDGTDHGRFIITTGHPDETLAAVVHFATGWTRRGAGDEPPEVVRL